MLRTVADQPTLWEAILPEELRRLPDQLARVGALLDDPVFFTPFVPVRRLLSAMCRGVVASHRPRLGGHPHSGSAAGTSSVP